MIKFDLDLFKKVTNDIFLTDSPTGYTDNVIKVIESYVN